MGILDRIRKTTASASKPSSVTRRNVPEWAVEAGYSHGPEWVLDAFEGLAPLACVAGVMHYQDTLAEMAGPLGTYDQAAMPFDAILAREPDNEYDANAIGVGTEIDGTRYLVGHIGRDLAAYLAPLIDRRVSGSRASVTGVPGLVVSGRDDCDDDPRLYGVRLWLNHPDILEALGISLQRLADLTALRFKQRD